MKRAIQLIIIGLLVLAIVFLYAPLAKNTIERGSINGVSQKLLDGRCQNADYLYNQSDVVVEGTVGKTEGKEISGKIYTYHTIYINNYLKNDVGTNTITIAIPGGTIGGVTSDVEDQPSLKEGMKVRLYLIDNDVTGYRNICGFYGAHEIKEFSTPPKGATSNPTSSVRPT